LFRRRKKNERKRKTKKERLSAINIKNLWADFERAQREERDAKRRRRCKEKERDAKRRRQEKKEMRRG